MEERQREVLAQHIFPERPPTRSCAAGAPTGRLQMMILAGLMAIAFVIAGAAKLLRAKPLVAQFQEFGLPRWSILAVGALEVLGAAALFFNATRFWAALGLIALMLGAIANHLKVRHPISKVVPALLLLILAGTVAILSWGPQTWLPW